MSLYTYRVEMEDRENGLEINDIMRYIHLISRTLNSLLLPKSGIYPSLPLLVYKLEYHIALDKVIHPVCIVEYNPVKEYMNIDLTEDTIKIHYYNEAGLDILLYFEKDVYRGESLGPLPMFICSKKYMEINCDIYNNNGITSKIYEIITQILEPTSFIDVPEELRPEEESYVDTEIDLSSKPFNFYYSLHKKYAEVERKGIDKEVKLKENKYPHPQWALNIMENLEKESTLRKRLSNLGYINKNYSQMYNFIESNNLPIDITNNRSCEGSLNETEEYESDGYWTKTVKDCIYIIMTLKPLFFTESHKRYKFIVLDKEILDEAEREQQELEFISLIDYEDFSLRDIERYEHIETLEKLFEKVTP